MNYFLIDFENVRTEGIKDFQGVQKGDSIIVFYSENCKTVTLDILNKIFDLGLKYKGFCVKVGTKNALDFQLTSYLGYLIGQETPDACYHIVSEDRGFEAAVNFWQEQGISVRRTLLKQEVSVPKKETKTTGNTNKKSRVNPKDMATPEEVKALIGNYEDAEAVLEIFNQFKTKQAICNGLSKRFKDSKKAGKIYKKLKPLLKAKNKS